MQQIEKIKGGLDPLKSSLFFLLVDLIVCVYNTN